MTDWTSQAREALREGLAALVTILATEGSAPRGPGARMVVTETGLRGTIGGGNLEYQVTKQARAILAHPPGSWRVQDYPLGPLLGQCCGGRVRLLVERLGDVPKEEGPYLVELGERVERMPFPGAGRGPGAARGPRPEPGDSFIEPEEGSRLPVLLFGAGHVGGAIAARADGLPLHIAWFDSRPEAAESPGVVLAAEEEMIAAARAAQPEAAVVILTHDHGLDYRLTAAALASPARFVGLIGSRTKRARFESRLDKDGIDHSRLTCPIGLPGLAGKQPEVIAIALLAQLLMLEGPA
jgi:xanthine dehydrogenase accessory factor